MEYYERCDDPKVEPVNSPTAASVFGAVCGIRGCDKKACVLCKHLRFGEKKNLLRLLSNFLVLLLCCTGATPGVGRTTRWKGSSSRGREEESGEGRRGKQEGRQCLVGGGAML